MTFRDNGIFLLHIAESLEKILEYLKGMNEEAFSANSMAQDAVVRNYEIVGEAAKSITDDLRDKYPDIDWKGMAGLRDILIHQYFGIDLMNVWNISQANAPDVLKKIKSLPEYKSAKKSMGQSRD